MSHESLEELLPDYAAARQSDVLGLEEVLGELPIRNEIGGPEDVDFIVEALCGGVARARTANIGTRAQALAAIRDISQLLLSAGRHGEHPLRGDDNAAITMDYLATLADTPPSGSLSTLAVANPPRDEMNPGGVKRRRLTPLTNEEDLFLDVLTETSIDIDSALKTMAQGGLTPASLKGLAEACGMLPTRTAGVRRIFPPESFTGYYRPFFDPAYIGTRKFVTPNAGQSAVTAMQAILEGNVPWSEDTKYGPLDAIYRKFYMENYPHLTREERMWIGDILMRNDQKGSILVAVEQNDSELAGANMQVLESLLKFRLGHYRLAAENFNLREPDAKGGGQYDMTLLDHMIEKTCYEMIFLAQAFPSLYDAESIMARADRNRAWRNGLLADQLIGDIA